MIKEKALRFGKTAPLVGILSEPAAGTGSPNRPAIILLNSGILHRVGACRLHVNMARRAAADGFLVLRFDHGGIGDSESRRDSLPFEQSAVLEAREAMDYLSATKGVQQFVLIGLCSGADMAFGVGDADPRVVGMMLLDAWAYRTRRYYLHYYAKRLASPAAWKLFVETRLNRLRARRAAAAAPAAASTVAAAANGAGVEDADAAVDLPRYVREFPPKAQVEGQLRALMARRVELFLVFSGGQEECYNYQGQYRESFSAVDFADRLRVEYLADADHIFTNLAHQQYLVREMAAWTQRFAGGAAAVAAPAAAVAERQPQQQSAQPAVPARVAAVAGR